MSKENPTPYGYCHCGCGARAPISHRDRPDRGYAKGEPRRFIKGHYASRSLESRFWEKVDKRGPEECWEWRAGKDDGYGVIRIGRAAKSKAHRVAYELLVGPIPDGLMIDHLCRNRACVNPAHLEAVTQRVNNLRGESPYAKKARQTHCKHGHEFTEANTYRPPSAPHLRQCRACRARDSRRREQAKSKPAQ